MVLNQGNCLCTELLNPTIYNYDDDDDDDDDDDGNDDNDDDSGKTVW